MRNVLIAGATVAALALNGGALAADATKEKEKKPDAKQAPTASVPAVQKTPAAAAAPKTPDKGTEKGIILQKQPANASAQKVQPALKQQPAAADGSVKTLKQQPAASAPKTPDKGTEKGIILQK